MATILIKTRQLHQFAGGVERSAVWLANALAAQGNVVHVATFDDNAEVKPFFALSKEVNLHALAAHSPMRRATWKERIARHRKLRRVLAEDDVSVAIGFQVGSTLSLLLSSIGLRIKIVAAERNSPLQFRFLRRGRFRELLALIVLRCASIVVVQLESNARLYPRCIGSVHVIENPVPVNSLERTISLESTYRLLAVGRLSYQKNYADMLLTVDILRQKGFAVSLAIFGTGELQQEVNTWVERFALQDLVTIHKPSLNIQEMYGLYDALIHTALWEGFPNVVAEALAAGLPVVGCATTPGMSDLVRPGTNGELASTMNALSLAECVERLSLWSRNSDVETACKESVAHFTEERAARQWIKVLEVAEGAK